VYPAQNKPITLLFLLVIAFTGILFSSCQNQQPWQQEEDALILQAKVLDTKLDRLNASIDSLWDVTSAQLDKQLPADFPAIDRDIFIKARNADHIRMFMSYKELDNDTKALVNNAGIQDSLLAKQVRALYAEQQAFEQKKLSFLSKVEKQDKAASRASAEKFKSAENSIAN
jgi:hypothetical protein